MMILVDFQTLIVAQDVIQRQRHEGLTSETKNRYVIFSTKPRRHFIPGG